MAISESVDFVFINVVGRCRGWMTGRERERERESQMMTYKILGYKTIMVGNLFIIIL